MFHKCKHFPKILLWSTKVKLTSSKLIKVLTHPVAGSQESAVHTLLSSQLTAVREHPVAGSQESVVHLLLSSQLTSL